MPKWLGRAVTTPPPTPTAAPAAAAPRPVAVASTVPPRPAPARPAPALAPRVAATPGLVEDLRDPDPRVRAAALREAARDPDVDPALVLGGARDPDREVGVIATAALATLHAQGRVGARELTALIAEPGLDARVRTNALNALGLTPSAEAAALLVELLARGTPDERAVAAILLVHQDLAIATPALIAALADADERVRGNALEALRARARGRDFGTDAAAWAAWWQRRAR